MCKRPVVMRADFLKDNSVRLLSELIFKNPTVRIILDDLVVQDDTERSLFLIVDVDEHIDDIEAIYKRCKFGGWIYHEYLEIFDKDMSLLLLKDWIPKILEAVTYILPEI